jgi:hypothetical protein
MSLPAGTFFYCLLGHKRGRDLAFDMAIWPIMALVILFVCLVNMYKEYVNYTPEKAKAYRKTVRK